LKIINYIIENFKIKFIKDTSYTLASHFLVGISGLLINTLIGNYYGASALGVINQALSFYMIISLFANFGIQTSSQKYTSQYINNRNIINLIFTSSIISTIITSIITIFLFILFLNFFPSTIKSVEVKEILQLFLYAVPLFALNKSINNFLTGLRNMKTYSFARGLRWLIVIIAVILIVINKMSLNMIATSFILSEFIIFIFLMFHTYKYLGKIKINWVCNHISFGAKSFISEFVANFNTRVPILFIGYILGDAAAGYYSYIEVFAFSIMMFSSALQKNFNPVFTQLWHQNKIREIETKILKVFKNLTLVTVPLFIMIFVLYYFYTVTFMTEDYLEYNYALIVLLLGGLIKFLFGPFASFLIMTDHLYLNLFRVIFYAVINIIIAVILLEPLGIIGASIGFFISTFINILILNYLYNKKIKLNLFTLLFKNL